MENTIFVKYISDNWAGCNVRVQLPITMDQLNNGVSHLTHTLKDFKLHLIEIIPNVFKFYAEQLNDDEEHCAGYKWASNVKSMNEYFGTELVDVDGELEDYSSPRTYGINVHTLKELLPKGYCIVKHEYDYKVIQEEFLESYLNKQYELI